MDRKLYMKEYYIRTKNDAKEYYIKNKPHIKEIQKKYKIKNKDKLSIYNKKYNRQYFLNNPHKILDSNKKILKKIGLDFNMESHEYSLAVLSWSKTIKKRDGLCQVCGGVGQISHHIIHKKHYPRLSLNVNNGITLCKWCHSEVHGFKH